MAGSPTTWAAVRRNRRGRRRNNRLPVKSSSSPTLAPEAAHGHQALSGYIRARFDEFSRSQKDVAQYIVDHLDEAAFQTAEELARRANTSSSTVVRFSQALGFEGFPELQQAARDEYRRQVGGGAVNGARRRDGRAAVLAGPHGVRGRARGRPRQRRGHRPQAVAPTWRRDRRDRLAEKVLIAGTDQMAFFASYLRHLLMLLDIRAEVVASPSQEALGRLAGSMTGRSSWDSRRGARTR